ncbi:sulfite exporter TauE/SafE family protein [Conexibacter woesei]|uniref:Probable membrane transporter protein n=1 Tax=Conexibacter woesei (strain DSM 14684 / CCUG 47730 / CIP 108061 / JCM 11494 / NBRC 100937 / ID131577) TaxID=469383 RepID=D3FAM3_CONWI|nr:sulfite exporter TauE/SafE family protein [Conexibacter woesei]ADB51186.1 conserved hypothetical protein [Conexibacter woesei DSM 14684]
MTETTTTQEPAAGTSRSTLAGIGLAGGFMSGLLGIGGGTVMVPLMVLFARFGQRDAHAISLAAIIPISIAAIAVYGGAGKGDLLVAAGLTIGAVLGARTGAGLLAKAPDRVLKAAFGIFMLIAAASIVLEG